MGQVNRWMTEQYVETLHKQMTDAQAVVAELESRSVLQYVEPSQLHEARAKLRLAVKEWSRACKVLRGHRLI